MQRRVDRFMTNRKRIKMYLDQLLQNVSKILRLRRQNSFVKSRPPQSINLAMVLQIILYKSATRSFNSRCRPTPIKRPWHRQCLIPRTTTRKTTPTKNECNKTTVKEFKTLQPWSPPFSLTQVSPTTVRASSNLRLVAPATLQKVVCFHN